MDRLRNERDYRSETLPGNSLRPKVTTIRCYARPYQLQDWLRIRILGSNIGKRGPQPEFNQYRRCQKGKTVRLYERSNQEATAADALAGEYDTETLIALNSSHKATKEVSSVARTFSLSIKRRGNSRRPLFPLWTNILVHGSLVLSKKQR